MRGFSLQGLFVDTALTGDDPIATIEGLVKTGYLQKIIYTTDELGM
jgi:hypothetical protein